MLLCVIGLVNKNQNQISKRGKIDAPSKQIHDRSLFCPGTGTSITSGGVNLVV